MIPAIASSVYICLSRQFLRLSVIAILVGAPCTCIVVSQSALAAPRAESPVASAVGIEGLNAQVNGAPIRSGSTLFPGDVIQLGMGSSVALRFGSSVVIGAPLTEFIVGPAGVNLRNGRIQVRAGKGGSFAVEGAFFHVSLPPSATAPGAADISVHGEHALVSAVTNVVELTTVGSADLYKLHAGETAALGPATEETGSGQSAGTASAGQVSRLVPQVEIDRGSQQSAAAVATPVFWNDDLRSRANGRARVALNDGSVLNLGSNSELRVIQHDAQSQQTALDLAVGRMRGQVMKLTRPKSKFEVRTPMGMAGLVGTDFYLNATADFTELIVFDGVVRFTPNGAQQSAMVTAGMKLVVSRTGTVTGPLRATQNEIQTARNLTDVPDASSQTRAAAVRKRVPILVTITAGGATMGIGLWLSTRQAVSPVTLGN